MTKLAKALRMYLAAQDIEQQALAQELGVSEAMVSRFLAGQGRPEAITSAKIYLWLLQEESSK